MLLTLQRTSLGPRATLGHLDIDGVAECVTLEDVVRLDDPATPKDEGAKIQDQTAIPAGRYKVVIDFSQRFGKLMLHVLDVPGFTGIRIHSGNTHADTSGCILVGLVVDGPDRIHGGSVALPRLFTKVKAALDRREEVWITVLNEFGVG